jgi:hypothetical protein
VPLTSGLIVQRVSSNFGSTIYVSNHVTADMRSYESSCILKGTLTRTLNRSSFEVPIDVKEILVDAMTSRVRSRKTLCFEEFTEVDVTVHAPFAITHYFCAGEFIMIERDVTGEIAYDLRRCYDAGVPDVEFPTQPISIFILGTKNFEIEESAVPIKINMISFMAVVETEHGPSLSMRSRAVSLELLA